MEFGPDLRAGLEGQQSHGLTAVTQDEHKQADTPVAAAVWIADHGAGAVIHLRLFSGWRENDGGGCRCRVAAQLADEAFHALVATAEAVVIDQILVNRLGVAAPAEREFDEVEVLAALPRFDAAVLVSAGLQRGLAPEVDGWNYAPRVKTPVLMLNGRDDVMYPLETSQIPLFQALGTPERDKRRVLYDGGHSDFANRMEVVKEALDWLDLYLGPVKLER